MLVCSVKRLHRLLKRARHAAQARFALLALRPELERFCGGPVQFSLTEGGGKDFVFYVSRGRTRVAVLRMANPDSVPDGTPIEHRLSTPRLRLTGHERIAREYRICASGAPFGITAAPLWLAPDGTAFMCAYVPGERLLKHVARGRLSMWDAIDLAAAHTVAFQDATGEAHMDLSLLNVLGDDTLEHLTFIDFETGPDPSLSSEEIRLFDFLKLVETSIKFMNPADRAAAPARFARMLQTLHPELRSAPTERIAPKLKRLIDVPSLCAVLSGRGGLYPANPTKR